MVSSDLLSAVWKNDCGFSLQFTTSVISLLTLPILGLLHSHACNYNTSMS